MVTLFADRTRYLTGFACPWRRLLGFHAFGTGLSHRRLAPPLSTGIFTHQALEAVLSQLSVSQTPPSPDQIQTAARAAEVAYLAAFTDSGGWSVQVGQDFLKEQLTIVSGLTHGWSRCVLPWLNDTFEIKEIESECSFEPHPGIVWMARPDFVAYDRVSQTYSIHDFKTTSYWSDSNLPEWSDSVQMMLNAAAVTHTRGYPITSYYIHILLKGSKRYPTVITHPYYRPGIQPFQTEAWKSRWTKDKSFSRVLVTDYRAVGDWVWEMPYDDLAKFFPVVGPFPVDQRKIDQFIRGLLNNERHWHEQTKDLDWSRWPHLDFQEELDRRFPRTFQCYTYGQRCPFYSLCFKRTGWQDPLTGEYETRQPHHPQEQPETGEEDV